MSFLQDALFFILGSFLAISNTLAAPLISLTELFEENDTEMSDATLEQPLARVDSQFSAGKLIPQILIDNARYQEAALFSSQTYPGATTADPKEALVNIFCTRLTDKFIRTTTGTGFFIHPDGVILTNAHVAQFLLLEKTPESGEVECIIRTGNPAVAQYRAELLYLPPSWIVAHAEQISVERPSGTGERDYALLYVTAGLENRPLPRVFPSLQVDPSPLARSIIDADVTAAGYPASALAQDGPQAFLKPQIATSSISQLYTFGSNYADLFSIRGSSIGEHGSSGGPVIGPNGEVIGIISTRGDDLTDGAGSLRAITAAHIDRTIREETGFSLQSNVEGDLPIRSAIFNETLVPFLSQILSRQLASSTSAR